MTYSIEYYGLCPYIDYSHLNIYGMKTNCLLIKSFNSIEIGGKMHYCLRLNYEPSKLIILDNFMVREGVLEGDVNEVLTRVVNAMH